VKKIFLPVLMIIALLFAVGCGKSRSISRNKGDRINITATIFPAYDFVRQIVGKQGLENKVNLTMLLPPGAESHSFEPSPRDIITIQNTDVFIFVGGDSDIWIERILRSVNTENMKILAMMDMVDVVEEEFVEGMEHDHDHYDGDEFCEDVEYDEHVWTSPVNAILIVRAIAELLGEADPANAATYNENAAAYIRELEKLDVAFSEVVAGARRKTIVFGDRFPFRYLANEYGLEYFAAFPSCSTETEPSAATVAFLINKVKSEKIPVIFHLELSNEKMADTISEETGAKKLQLHSTHNVTKRDFEAGANYVDLQKANVVNLKAALW